MTSQQIRTIWIKIAIPFCISLLLLAAGLVMQSMQKHSLAGPAAFSIMGACAGIFLFGLKAVQFIIYLRKNRE